jgi:Flp pilus assembly protein TadB
MLPTVAPDVTSDQARWAEAQSVLDRTPTQSAEQRLRRWRHYWVLFLVALVLLVVVIIVLFRGTFEAHPPNVPTWQAVIGFVIAGAGLVLQIFGVVTLWRANRSQRAWRSPLAVLTRAQRKELLTRVRGLQPVEPARLPLARYLAEQRWSQRSAMLSNSGLGIAWVGLWIASPTWWRAVMTVAYGLLLVVAWPFTQREARRARRFLDEHPLPTD